MTVKDGHSKDRDDNDDNDTDTKLALASCNSRKSYLIYQQRARELVAGSENIC